MTKFSLAFAVVLVLFAGMASASPVVCGSAGVANVVGYECQLDGLTFSNFDVSSTAGVVVGLHQAPGTGMLGNSANLMFGLSIPTGYPADTRLHYSVTGTLYGVDLHLGIYSGDVQITENVCLSDPGFQNCPQGSQIAQLAVNPGNVDDIAMFDSPVSGTVWIMKDIQINEGATLSDFTNSHIVPEPATFLLMGAGLLGIGLLGKRRGFGKK